MSPLRWHEEEIRPEDIEPKGTGKPPAWHKYIKEFEDATPGRTFYVEPEGDQTERQLKVQLTKAAEYTGKGIEYFRLRGGITMARVLEAPRKRPAYKPKGEAAEGSGRRGRPPKARTEAMQ